MLVLVPLLWTALGTGIPIFLGCAKTHPRWFITVPSALAVAVLPFVVATSWWAFYRQNTFTGYLLLAATLIPLTVWTIINFVRAKDQPEPPALQFLNVRKIIESTVQPEPKEPAKTDHKDFAGF
jgi:hypothetical protein